MQRSWPCESSSRLLTKFRWMARPGKPMGCTIGHLAMLAKGAPHKQPLVMRNEQLHENTISPENETREFFSWLAALGFFAKLVSTPMDYKTGIFGKLAKTCHTSICRNSSIICFILHHGQRTDQNIL